jgi:G3E family GTPase
MRIIQIAGFLGSGKTSAIISLARTMSGEFKKRVALVVNEIGEIPVDGKVVEEYGLRVKDLGGGCICCEIATSFTNTLILLSQTFKPDFVLVEPTGVAIPNQVKLAALMARRDCDITLGPAVVLFDATRPEELLFDDILGNIVVRQVSDADIIAISKIDAVNDEQLVDCEQQVRKINQNAKITRISSTRGDGMRELLKLITESVEYPAYQIR